MARALSARSGCQFLGQLFIADLILIKRRMRASLNNAPELFEGRA